MIATSPGTPPIGLGEEEDIGELVEVGILTRLVGPVLDLGIDGVEELLTMCVTGLEGLGLNVTLCPEVGAAGAPVTFIFNIVTGCEDVDILVEVVGAVLDSVILTGVLAIDAGVVVDFEVVEIEPTLLFFNNELSAVVFIPQHIPNRKPSAQVPSLLPSDRIHSQANMQVPSSPIEFLHGFELILRPFILWQPA